MEGATPLLAAALQGHTKVEPGPLDHVGSAAADSSLQMCPTCNFQLRHEQNYGHVNIPHPSSRSRTLDDLLDGS